MSGWLLQWYTLFHLLAPAQSCLSLWINQQEKKPLSYMGFGFTHIWLIYLFSLKNFLKKTDDFTAWKKHIFQNRGSFGFQILSSNPHPPWGNFGFVSCELPNLNPRIRQISYLVLSDTLFLPFLLPWRGPAYLTAQRAEENLGSLEGGASGRRKGGAESSMGCPPKFVIHINHLVCTGVEWVEAQRGANSYFNWAFFSHQARGSRPTVREPM